MFIIGYFIMALAKLLNAVLLFFMWIVIARAVLSWVNPDPYNQVVRFIHNITEPVLHFIRRRLPVFFGGIDLSPLIVILGVYFIRDFVVQSLLRISSALL